MWRQHFKSLSSCGCSGFYRLEAHHTFYLTRWYNLVYEIEIPYILSWGNLLTHSPLSWSCHRNLVLSKGLKLMLVSMRRTPMTSACHTVSSCPLLTPAPL